ncbi:hypothetical protein FB446DRAFT_703663 [Lentinula raphanica]|nr:hypothetical protein FB446DRAFT_703663 [Lentinula raphanica]
MQLQFWARNLASGASIELTPSHLLHLTNISIVFDFADAFAPTSLLLSVALANGCMSPHYTIATLIAGKSDTIHIDVRLDEGIRYVLTVNGPNALSILGYYTQASDIDQSAPPRPRNSTFQDSRLGSIKAAPAPTSVGNSATTGSGAVPSSTLDSDMAPSMANNPSLIGTPLVASPLVASPLVASPFVAPPFVTFTNGHPQQGSISGTNAIVSQAVKPMRYRRRRTMPAPEISASNPNDNARASKRVRTGDQTFTNRYSATEDELDGGLGENSGTTASEANLLKRKVSSTARS